MDLNKKFEYAIYIIQYISSLCLLRRDSLIRLRNCVLTSKLIFYLIIFALCVYVQLKEFYRSEFDTCNRIIISNISVIINFYLNDGLFRCSFLINSFQIEFYNILIMF